MNFRNPQKLGVCASRVERGRGRVACEDEAVGPRTEAIFKRAAVMTVVFFLVVWIAGALTTHVVNPVKYVVSALVFGGVLLLVNLIALYRNRPGR